MGAGVKAFLGGGAMIFRILRIISILLRASLQAQLQYRANMIAGLISAGLGVAGSMIAFWAIFTQAESLGGWSFQQILVLIGVAHITFFVMDFWLWPNLSPVSQYVQKGEMDGILIKPLPPLLTVTFRHAGSPGEAGNLICGLVILIYGMISLEALSITNLLLFMLAYLAGIVIIYSIWAGLVTLAFWFTKVEEFASIFYFTTSVGNFPVTAFPPAARVFFTFILPVAFVTNIPAQAAFGGLNWQNAGLAFFFALLMLGLCHMAWRWALKSYTSASS